MFERNEILDVRDDSERGDLSCRLSLRRDVVPEVFNAHTPLSHILGDLDNDDIDPVLFASIVDEAFRYFQEMSPDFKLLPLDRYVVRHPSKDDDIGGFHGKGQGNMNAGGYFCYDDMGFGTLLNKDNIPNIRLRTYELARNYLHDSMHASTFRSMRVGPDGQEHRFQYGINFRDFDNTSFSAPDGDDEGRFVNLNIFMEGFIQKIIGDFIREKAPEDHAFFTEPGNGPDNPDVSDRERAVWADITEPENSGDVLPEAQPFIDFVMAPTARYMNFWEFEFETKGLGSANDLRRIYFHAMMSGDLSDLRQAYDDMIGIDNAWDTLFRQDAFTSDLATYTSSPPASPKDDYVCVFPFGYFST